MGVRKRPQSLHSAYRKQTMDLCWVCGVFGKCHNGLFVSLSLYFDSIEWLCPQQVKRFRNAQAMETGLLKTPYLSLACLKNRKKVSKATANLCQWEMLDVYPTQMKNMIRRVFYVFGRSLGKMRSS